ncbi:MAG TPA: hypothetical protein VG406_16195 [Isosphaeraceae bacterium]|jgi:hypothetical protein|nr:hypothetical protein [Isosphaeraceae bacterium]
MDDHPNDSGAPPGEDLQFDHAEFDGPAAAAAHCAGCKRPLDDAYYAVNAIILCEPCRDLILARLVGGPRLVRFARATALGAGAAMAGFALYFGVLKLTGLEIGLISILVGLMVGGAVRAGARGRGGWAYQGLAMFLTYTAIVASYTALIAPGMVADLARRQDAAKAEARKAAPAIPAQAGKAAAPGARRPSLAGLLVALGILLALLYALPIVAGFHQPIGLLIVGFALWESWKINRPARLEVTGPHLIGAGDGRVAGGLPADA